MDINLFDFYLPEELIAQRPSDKRDHSRLLVIDKDNHTYEDKMFYNIIDLRMHTILFCKDWLWIKRSSVGNYECPFCNAPVIMNDKTYNFCPFCGKRIESEK